MTSESVKERLEHDFKKGVNVVSFTAKLADVSGGIMVYRINENGVVVVATKYVAGALQMTLRGKGCSVVQCEDNAGDMNYFSGTYVVDLNLAAEAITQFLMELEFGESFPWVEFEEIEY